METLISRDTDILREYLAVLDARERGLSPFATVAATYKLARLRRELSSIQLETTDDDITALQGEIDERLDRTLLRRICSRRWSARVAVFLLLVLAQQLGLAAVLFASIMFVNFVPPLGNWNPEYPHDQPLLMVVFIFLFFFLTPILALAVIYGGRYFSGWRITVPATILILAWSIVATALVFRANPYENPVRSHSSLTLFARERGVNVASYREWVAMNWLMKDAKLQRDYENYLRRGPGRWITASIKDDPAWVNSLPLMNEYLDGGHDPAGFREWLSDYLIRNRVYSDDRVPVEVNAMTADANQRFLGVWQLEPFLKERDERIYRAYLGAINSSMRRWGLLSLGIYGFLLLVAYMIGPALSVMDRASGRSSRSSRSTSSSFGLASEQNENPSAARMGLRERYNSFPERSGISTPPFFDAPFKLMSRIHRSFLGFAVSTVILVFAFWAAVYALDLAGGSENASSQVEMMRSNLLFGGTARPARADLVSQAVVEVRPQVTQTPAIGPTREAALAARVSELESRLEDGDYESTKKFKEQSKIIAAQRSEIDLLRGLASQLQESTSALPTQVAELTTRTTAAEARAGEVLGEVGAARQKVDTVEKQLTTKLGEVETRTNRAADQLGRVEDRASVLATRTDELEKELDRRAGQVEARTEELGERTAGLKEREEKAVRLQRIAFEAIVSSIRSSVEDLDRRVKSTFYRLFNKGEAQREVESLRGRISQLTSELRDSNDEQAKELITQLEELDKRVEQIANRVN
jgi:hypothetical protein